jgi:S1-C subfamily serine protease
MKQGTAFHLLGVGLVTCEHVLGDHTYAFRSTDLKNKYPVTIRASNTIIDLAILDVNAPLSEGLTMGSADSLKQMDHLMIAGFPNYRLGDSGVVIPGLVVGFRPASGIRRVLTNASIVAGTSGGPVLGREDSVIGVAVTGADRMEEAQETENHGVIPIEALRYILST